MTPALIPCRHRSSLGGTEHDLPAIAHAVGVSHQILSYPITIEVICPTYGRNRRGGTRQYRKSTLCVGRYCGIELTESIQANILRCLTLGTGRLGLRRSKPVLRMRKPTLDYVAGPHRFRCIY